MPSNDGERPGDNQTNNKAQQYVLAYRTRGKKNPKGLPRVFFASHPDDFEVYFQKTVDMVDAHQDVAFFFALGDMIFAVPDKHEIVRLALSYDHAAAAHNIVGLAVHDHVVRPAGLARHHVRGAVGHSLHVIGGNVGGGPIRSVHFLPAAVNFPAGARKFLGSSFTALSFRDQKQKSQSQSEDSPYEGEPYLFEIFVKLT